MSGIQVGAVSHPELNSPCLDVSSFEKRGDGVADGRCWGTLWYFNVRVDVRGDTSKGGVGLYQEVS